MSCCNCALALALAEAKSPVQPVAASVPPHKRGRDPDQSAARAPERLCGWLLLPAVEVWRGAWKWSRRSEV